MLKLPLNIPQNIAVRIAPVLDAPGIAELIPQLVQGVRELFCAEAAMLTFQFTGQAQRKASICSQSGCADCSESSAWFGASVHDLIVRDLRARLCPVSYSEFTWPYARGQIGDADGLIAQTVPAAYSLLLPISSDLVVYDQRHRSFFGYLALFFNDFPQADEAFVQPVMSLPSLLSEAVAVIVAREEYAARHLDSAIERIRRQALLQKALLDDATPGAIDSELCDKLRTSVHAVLSETGLLMVTTNQHAGSSGPLLQEVNFNQLIEQTVESARAAFECAGVRLAVDLDGRVGVCSIDSALLSSAVYNLLDNALKFSDRGGQVVVRTRVSGNRGVRLEVEDYGRPVDETEREAIFDKLVRGSNSNGVSGNGWGLYIAQCIVHSHRGRIKLENLADGTDAAGKRFVIELPRAAAANGRPESPDGERPQAGRQ